MISNQQMQRALEEFENAAFTWLSIAKSAEREREHQNYLVAPEYNREKAVKSHLEYEEADYMAESRAMIRDLIREAIKNKPVPHIDAISLEESPIPSHAICMFRDGDQWCAVNGDFKNLQESDAGFGKTFEEAMIALNQSLHSTKQLAEWEKIKAAYPVL